MNRFVSVVVLVLLLAGLAGGARITRYRYYDVQGIPLFRVDRWTGMREKWDCRMTDESGKILQDAEVTPEGYVKRGNLVSPFEQAKTVCGWDANQ